MAIERSGFWAARAAVVVAAVFALGTAVASCKRSGRDQQPAASVDGLESRWGIEIASLRPSAGGFMLDFRFRIQDPDKARPLLSKTVEPYAIDLKSGARLGVPRSAKIGSLRSRGDGVAGQVNYIIFDNTQQLVKSGDRVAVVVEDFRSGDLTVQ